MFLWFFPSLLNLENRFKVASESKKEEHLLGREQGRGRDCRPSRKRSMGITNFLVPGDPTAVLSTLFEMNDEGRILFGGSARTSPGCEIDRLLCEEVEFTDYLMEGVVSYTLRAFAQEQGLRIELRKLRTNRDQYIDGHIKFYIEKAGLVVEDDSPI